MISFMILFNEEGVNMFIKSLTVGGFKNLSTTKINFGKLIVLASPNNFGKSNLIEAIDFGFAFIEANSKQRKSMMSWISGIPLTPELSSEKFTFEIEIDVPELKEHRYINYGFSFSWFRDDTTGQQITDEWLKVRKNESTRYTSLFKRNEGNYRKSSQSQARSKINLSDSQLMIDILSATDEIEITDIIKAIQNVHYRTCAVTDVSGNFATQPVKFLDESENTGFNNNNVPEELFVLKENYPEKFELFKDALFTLFPEFSDVWIKKFEIKISVNHQDKLNDPIPDVPFKVREDAYALFIKSDHLNQPVSVLHMSAGTQRIIWLLANIFGSNYKGISLLGIEELETSIHPKLLKNFIEIIFEAQEDTNIILSSHSPFLIKYLKTEQIYLGVPNKGVATFRRIAKNNEKKLILAARNLGISVSEYLFELMSSSGGSVDILNQFLENHNNE